jgi:type I restriction enzyme R subunit
MLEWDDGDVPDEVSAAELNKFLFNTDTVDKVLSHLMTNGIHVKGGDQLGKTIIFAKNQKHAEFIEERFNANWPHFGGQFARIITHKADYAQSLIDDFSIADKAPHIAISVDMLDTGIDVPEVVNLVFFKLVRSKTKFWQMVGRGTRLCPDLFGPGADKTTFRIFDFCQNLEFFGQDPATKETPIGRSLTERLFDSRVALIQRLEQDLAPPADGAQEEGDNFEPHPDAAPSLDRIVADTRKQLQDAVSSMNLDNFVVRTERRLVEKYQIETSWGVLDEAAADELGQIAGLPNSLAGEREEAKRFDLLVLSLQLALLNGEARFDRLQRQLIEIAAALEVRASVPAIKQHIHLIENVQTDGWWEGVTVPLLELVRRRLRHVVHLIDRTDRTILYSDFEDDLEATTHHKLPGTSGVDLDSVRRKARAFLREHEDNIALAKVRRGAELTGTDLLALEKMLVEAGIATHEDVERAAAAANGFANFIRSLVGMDRDAAQTLFADFLDERATANQIEFVDMIVKHLTENGTMKASAIYDSPFKEIAPLGPEEIFQEADVEDLLSRIRLTSAQKGRQNG